MLEVALFWPTWFSLKMLDLRPWLRGRGSLLEALFFRGLGSLASGSLASGWGNPPVPFAVLSFGAVFNLLRYGSARKSFASLRQTRQLCIVGHKFTRASMLVCMIR